MADFLVFTLHGALVRAAARHEECHFEGLGEAARKLWRNGRIGGALKKKLLAVETAYNVTRHITQASARDLEAQVANCLAVVGDDCQAWPDQQRTCAVAPARVAWLPGGMPEAPP